MAVRRRPTSRQLRGVTRLRVLALIYIVAGGLWCMEAAAGQTSGPGADPLAVKQELVRDRLVRLEDRMFRLREKLRESEPERAERLARAIRAGKELLIQQRIERAAKLIRRGDIEKAFEIQQRVAADMQRVLRILTEQGPDPERQEEWIERLEEILEELDGLIADQKNARNRAAETAARKDQEAGRTDQTPEGRDLPGTDRQAETQRDIAERADALADRMSGEESASDDSGRRREPGAEPSEPVLGAASVKNGSESMGRAAAELDRKQPAGAVPHQERALQALKEARREIEDQLGQSRQAQQEHLLAELENRLRRMLAGQEAITKETASLAEIARQEWSRSEKLKVVGLARDERGLGQDASEAVHMLREDGTIVVIPAVLESLAHDFEETAVLLDRNQVVGETPRLQADIEGTLRELLDALRQQREKNQQGRGEEQQAGGSAPPLLPGSVELKLLKALQLRVTNGTRRIGEHGATPAADTQELRSRALRLADRQREVAAMARRLNQRMSQ